MDNKYQIVPQFQRLGVQSHHVISEWLFLRHGGISLSSLAYRCIVLVIWHVLFMCLHITLSMFMPVS